MIDILTKHITLPKLNAEETRALSNLMKDIIEVLEKQGDALDSEKLQDFTALMMVAMIGDHDGLARKLGEAMDAEAVKEFGIA